jgi:hypothetical protein
MGQTAKGFRFVITPQEGARRFGPSDVIARAPDASCIYTENLNLMHEAQRQQLAGRLAQLFDEPLEVVQGLVDADWGAAVDAWQVHMQTTPDGPAGEGVLEDIDDRAARLLNEMSAEVRAGAADLLQSPDLLERIIEDVEGQGVAGELQLAAVLYLSGTSRLLDNPVSTRVKGPSSSGKTHVIRKVAGLFPPEAVLRANSITPQALYYLEAGSLRHRWVVAGERSRLENDDTAEATKALREMISDGRISKAVTVRIGGEMQTLQIEQDGPIAFVESTTLDAIFDEDENRCVSLFTDEREEQTQTILSRIAADARRGVNPADLDGVVQLHHAIQRTLRRRRVIIPYADRLEEGFPKKRVEARRAFSQLLGMIRASALLHQFQREESDGYVVATPDDYRLARDLLEEPMRRLLKGDVGPHARRFHERLSAWFPNGETFTITNVLGKESYSRASVETWVKELHRDGSVEKVEEHRGSKAAVWKATALANRGSALPSNEKVFDSP